MEIIVLNDKGRNRVERRMAKSRFSVLFIFHYLLFMSVCQSPPTEDVANVWKTKKDKKC